MKPFRKIAIAALAASVAGTALTAGVPAFAQGGAATGNGGQQIQQAQDRKMAHQGERRGWGRGHGRGGQSQRAERLFDRFDADDDGVITRAEIEDVEVQEFAAADADGNGEISLEEFKARFMDRSKDRMVRAFQFLDSNGDGTVTQQEVDVVANRMFNRLDRDGNGTVERVRGQRGQGAQNEGARQQRAERGERRGQGGPQHGRGGQARMFMGLFDTDGSGSVTREDFDARRAELFALADTTGSGSFTLEDFGPLWLAVNEDRIVDRFQRADADGSLGITREEAGKRADSLMNRADRNKDGVITGADFRGGKKGGKGKKHRG